MQVAANGPQEFLGLKEGRVFLRSKYAAIHQFCRGLHLVHVFRDPEQRLQIAKAAFALFDVRLNNISLPALLAVAFSAFF